jgi:hypothetical protein
MPRFSSQTRTAARINLLVRAIVPIPGNRASIGDASISGGFLRFGPRFDAAWAGRRRVGD